LNTSTAPFVSVKDKTNFYYRNIIALIILIFDVRQKK